MLLLIAYMAQDAGLETCSSSVQVPSGCIMLKVSLGRNEAQTYMD
jgi:hypothetical protein